jgi:DNA polymerase III alpha subunit
MGMLQVLEQALAYGQKQQADRLAGQGSIFDEGFGAADTSSERNHPPVPSEEFEKPDLLRLAKEKLSLDVSENPLSSMRNVTFVANDAVLNFKFRRRRAHVDHLVRYLHELIEIKRAIIERARETKPIIYEHGLA